ncbi:MAG TPA: glycoside hydrolase family 3 N-terminal domain-containing protein [Microcella sp.]|nr:glycoside hydrolase family 3 N-terminal domain-containing protein [Microcella sp.]
MVTGRKESCRGGLTVAAALATLALLGGCAGASDAPSSGSPTEFSAAEQSAEQLAEQPAEQLADQPVDSSPRAGDAMEPPTKGTGAPPPVDADEQFLTDTLASWTLERTVASLVMITHPGTDPAPARALLEAHGFGGFLVMGANTGGPPEVTSAFTAGLSADPLLPVLTAVDQEGGDVRRLPGDTGPAGRALHGADLETVEQSFTARSSLVDAAGIAVNFGVVADVTADPAAFIHRRVLDTTPSAAAERVAAAVRGEGERTFTTLKHFPGHGASPDDSHVSIPRSAIALDEWRATHALPFVAGIDAGAELVMTGHLQFDAVSPHPASLSPTWMRVLRSELGFDGVIVTDDLVMLQRSGRPEFADPHENAVRALAAGNDLLLFVVPADPTAVGLDPARLVSGLADAVRSGEVDADQVAESARRVLELRRALSAEPAPSCGPACERESVRAHWRDG